MRLLEEIAYVRSGDKGDTVSIGVLAKRPQDYALLKQSITDEAVRRLFGDWVKGRIEIYPMANIEAVVVLLRNALGGGATRTLRLDQTAKSLGNAILRLEISRPDPS